MAIKNIVARGIGFSPGSVGPIVMHGFTSAEFIAPTAVYNAETILIQRYHDIKVVNGFNETIVVDKYHSLIIL